MYRQSNAIEIVTYLKFYRAQDYYFLHPGCRKIYSESSLQLGNVRNTHQCQILLQTLVILFEEKQILSEPFLLVEFYCILKDPDIHHHLTQFLWVGVSKAVCKRGLKTKTPRTKLFDVSDVGRHMMKKGTVCFKRTQYQCLKQKQKY